MLLRNKFKLLDDSVTHSFNNVKRDVNNILTAVRYLRQDVNRNENRLNDMLEELATNGVVRDLRKLQKEFVELRDHTASLIMDHDRQLEDMKTNGVATAINKLNEEVFNDRKDSPDNNIFRTMLLSYKGLPVVKDEEATLAGKVDAIVAHLGLDVTVQPKEVKAAKVVAKKKTVTKKKGKR